MGPQRVRHNWATEHTQTLPFIEYIFCTSLNSLSQISLSAPLATYLPQLLVYWCQGRPWGVFSEASPRLRAGTSGSFQKFQTSQDNTRHGSDILKCCKKVLNSGSECEEVWDLIWLVPHRANFKQGKTGDRWNRKMGCLYLHFSFWYIVLKSVFSMMSWMYLRCVLWLVKKEWPTQYIIALYGSTLFSFDYLESMLLL